MQRDDALSGEIQTVVDSLVEHRKVLSHLASLRAAGARTRGGVEELTTTYGQTEPEKLIQPAPAGPLPSFPQVIQGLEVKELPAPLVPPRARKRRARIDIRSGSRGGAAGGSRRGRGLLIGRERPSYHAEGAARAAAAPPRFERRRPARRFVAGFGLHRRVAPNTNWGGTSSDSGVAASMPEPPAAAANTIAPRTASAVQRRVARRRSCSAGKTDLMDGQPCGSDEPASSPHSLGQPRWTRRFRRISADRVAQGPSEHQKRKVKAPAVS